jgi:hypothetical protein
MYWSKYSENWEQHTSRINETEGNRRASGHRIQKKNGISSNIQRGKEKHGTPQIRITQLTQKNKKNAVGKPAWYKEQNTDKPGITGEKQKTRQKAHIQNPQERKQKNTLTHTVDQITYKEDKKEFRYLRCKDWLKKKGQKWGEEEEEEEEATGEAMETAAEQRQTQQIARERTEAKRSAEQEEAHLKGRRSGGGQGRNRSD